MQAYRRFLEVIQNGLHACTHLRVFALLCRRYCHKDVSLPILSCLPPEHIEKVSLTLIEPVEDTVAWLDYPIDRDRYWKFLQRCLKKFKKLKSGRVWMGCNVRLVDLEEVDLEKAGAEVN